MSAPSPRSFRHRHPAGTAAIPGIGTIVAVIRSDEGTQDHPHLRFVVRIDADGIDTYEAMAQATVPDSVARLLRPGVRVAVRLYRDKLDEPIVDLSRIWITPSLVRDAG